MRSRGFCLAFVLFLGCSHKPVSNDNTVQFRGCKVTEVDVTDGTVISCDCAHYRLGIDAKTGKRIAICGGR